MPVVYNMQRQWFTKQADAIAAARKAGLKKDSVLTLTVNGRDDIAALLNALCDPKLVRDVPVSVYSDEAAASGAPVEDIMEDLAERAHVGEDFIPERDVPLFLRKDYDPNAKPWTGPPAPAEKPKAKVSDFDDLL